VSNLTYGAGLAVAWIGFVRQMGKSPLMAGQWKAFLAFYAGALLHARQCSSLVHQLPLRDTPCWAVL
jgi:hypothetical protein